MHAIDTYMSSMRNNALEIESTRAYSILYSLSIYMYVPIHSM